jgi:rod shape-determining protein MreC
MTFFKNKLTVTILVLSVTFLFLITRSIKGGNASIVQNGIGMTLNSVQGVLYNINNKVKDSVGFIFSFNEVKSENETLKKENRNLQDMAIKYNDLKNENERLRNMLNFKNQMNEYNYVGCDIIGKGGGSYLDEFIINKGTKDGVGKRMVVTTADGLVGQVVTANNNWSVVQSLANENLAVSGMVESTEENSGIVKGYKDSENRQLAKLYYLPQDSGIKKDDVILTSGLGGLYPKGIRIGYVTDIEEDKGKVMKNAVLQPYVNFNKLEEVFVIIPKNKIDINYSDSGDTK